MPEHVHLLLSEPKAMPLATTLSVLKGETSKKLRGERPRFWQTRYYDFNVLTHTKHVEKLRYIHRNPVERGLVGKPEDWLWSSFNHYATASKAAWRSSPIGHGIGANGNRPHPSRYCRDEWGHPNV